jgi:hypothetical protein
MAIGTTIKTIQDIMRKDALAVDVAQTREQLRQVLMAALEQ